MISDPKRTVLGGKLSEEGGETVIRVEYAVITIAYLGLALGYLPGLRMTRASIALVSAGLLIALKVLTLQQAWDTIDSQTIDRNLLIMFSGLFILIKATQQLNLTAPLTSAIASRCDLSLIDCCLATTTRIGFFP
ncbi:hypothetical protein ACQ4M3_40465 [Leptolyngbya sp. AN03gr2]|uniref:hypothetical protein n=1 Tax=unclassified Leptolyngbya TaxID=2650499 RepID=UPI003D3244BC